MGTALVRKWPHLPRESEHVRVERERLLHVACGMDGVHEADERRRRRRLSADNAAKEQRGNHGNEHTAHYWSLQDPNREP